VLKTTNSNGKYIGHQIRTLNRVSRGDETNEMMRPPLLIGWWCGCAGLRVDRYWSKGGRN
jgi:hypothetical protein